MSDFRRLSRTIANINLEQIALDAFKAHKEEAMDLITESQLFEKGIDGTGAKITPPYTPFTRRIKSQKGQPTNRVTLKDTGDFHRGVFAKANNFPVIFGSNDSKTEELKFKYGEHILDLTQESKDELTEEHTDDYIKTEFLKQVKAAISVLR